MKSKAKKSYEAQAKEFCEKTNTKVKIEYYSHGRHFLDDKYDRDIYKFTISRNGKRYSGTFGNSVEGDEPTEYDILACMTKYDPESFHDFCLNYDYDESKINSKKIYKAVCKEYKGMVKLFGENTSEMEALREII